MAQSPVQICNVALLRIGQSQPIADLNEASVEAQACKTLYPHALDVLLGAWPWKFARARAELAELTGQSVRGNWARAFAPPSDCVRVRGLGDDFEQLHASLRTPFAVEVDDAGSATLILTDSDSAPLIYTRRVSAPALFSPYFTDALTWYLAAELVLGLKLEPRLEPMARGRFDASLRRAKVQDANLGAARQTVGSEFERVRGAGIAHGDWAISKGLGGRKWWGV